MSRVGKSPIPIPDKTTVEINGQDVTIKGPKGTLKRTIHADISATVENNMVIVTRPSEIKKHRALHGLTRALLSNMVVGVSDGYKKELEIIGVGYRAELQGRLLILNLGYSHPIVLAPPEGIDISVKPKEHKIIVEGIDKELVGEVTAKIRSLRKPEPYKGKGIRYVGELIRIKAGKSAMSS
ncbi:MAG: 50S ribosomal protein L6 [candidate division Zixibacteria bacterium]|nr:50S ribosomal protein L6 [candidate division Zixibacteria bacterium]